MRSRDESEINLPNRTAPEACAGPAQEHQAQTCRHAFVDCTCTTKSWHKRPLLIHHLRSSLCLWRGTAAQGAKKMAIFAPCLLLRHQATMLHGAETPRTFDNDACQRSAGSTKGLCRSQRLSTMRCKQRCCPAIAIATSPRLHVCSRTQNRV